MSPEKPHTAQSVDDHVVAICELGCTHVNRIIELLEQGLGTEELAGVPTEHHPALLIELKSIMAVYDAREDDE
jgi:hypothetical protein